jgi:type I site-specific restriction endonuclease
MTTEADARILIDRLLEQAGWIITDKAQVSTEEAAAGRRIRGHARHRLRSEGHRKPDHAAADQIAH